VRSSAAGSLLVATVLVVAIATAPLGTAALGCAFAITAVAAGHYGAGRTRRALLPVLPLILLSLVPVAFAAGVEHAARLSARAVAATATAIAIAGSVPTHELGTGFAALGVPRAVAAVLAGALRQTSVLGEEASRLLLARRLRGYSGYRAGASLLGVLLGRAADRAERIDLAARLRGCSPTRAVGRSNLSRADAPAIAAASTAAIALHVAGRLLQ
jgi:energy-coupling factor transporter transmembrane protein EcfT